MHEGTRPHHHDARWNGNTIVSAISTVHITHQHTSEYVKIIVFSSFNKINANALNMVLHEFAIPSNTLVPCNVLLIYRFYYR